MLKTDFRGHPISTWNSIPFVLSVKQYCQLSWCGTIGTPSLLLAQRNPHVIIVIVCIPLSALTSDTVLMWVYTKNIRMPRCRSFNHVPVTKTNAQYADCTTRQGKMLDLFSALVLYQWGGWPKYRMWWVALSHGVRGSLWGISGGKQAWWPPVNIQWTITNTLVSSLPINWTGQKSVRYLRPFNLWWKNGCCGCFTSLLWPASCSLLRHAGAAG